MTERELTILRVALLDLCVRVSGPHMKYDGAPMIRWQEWSATDGSLPSHSEIRVLSEKLQLDGDEKTTIFIDDSTLTKKQAQRWQQFLLSHKNVPIEELIITWNRFVEDPEDVVFYRVEPRGDSV